MSLTRVCAAWVALVAGANAGAQADYPSRPVRMVVPFAPGGAGDLVARFIQPRLTELLGQQVIVDNRPGAAGNIGIEVAGRATADGYTLLLGNVGAMAVNPALYARMPFDVFQQFRPISQVVDVPGALVVHPSVAAKSTAELIALLRAKPGQLNFGSSGGGSANRLEMELFLQSTGTRMVHVPYRGGAGQVITGLLGNEVQASFVTFSSVLEHARAGRARMLGAVARERVPAMPEVPTLREQGHAELSTGSWQGLYVRTGTPADVLRRLFMVTQQAMKDGDLGARMAKSGVTVVTSASGDDFLRFWRAEHERFRKVIKLAGIEVE